MDSQINIFLDLEMDPDINKDNEEIYNDFMGEIERNVFLRIGRSLISNEEIDHDDYSILPYIKTYEDSSNDYLEKLDRKILTFENKKAKLSDQINTLSLENKQLSDNIKLLETKMNSENIFVKLLQINKIKKKRANFQNILDGEREKYNTIFNIISKLHEEILKIDDYIKNINSYKQRIEI